MTKKIKAENIIYLFFILQPLISIYRTFFGDNLKLFGFSFFEMFNIFFIIGLWFYVFYTTKNKKMFYIIPYFILMGIYCVFHYYNISHFNTEIIDRSIYGIIQESYYIFRVYGLPVLLLFCLFFLKLKKEFFIKAICDIAFLVGAIIVVTNFMGLSLCTYASEGHIHLVQGNFFSWFFTNGTQDMERYTSSGWFSSGNEISGMLLMALPIITYHFLNKRNIKYTIYLAVVMLSMLMIGTKTATIGSGGVFVLVGVVYIVMGLVKKDRKNVKRCVLFFITALVLWGTTFYYSPYLQEEFPHYKETTADKNDKDDEQEKRVLKTVHLSNETESEREEAIDYINTNYWNHFINAQYIELYPVEKDLDFWIEKINREAGINQNYRAFKQELIQRIIERNDRKLDSIVGVGVLHELDCEKDYVYQYYMFGWIGVLLLLGLYIFILLKNIVFVLRNIKRIWKQEYMIYMCALGIGILLPYVTGHMIGITMSMFELVLIIILVECVSKEMQESMESLQ